MNLPVREIISDRGILPQSFARRSREKEGKRTTKRTENGAYRGVSVPEFLTLDPREDHRAN